MVKEYITIKRKLSITKSIPIEIKSLNLFIFVKTLYFEIYIGVNTIITPNKTESDATQNQFPPVYKQQTPKSKHRDKNIESGNKISLCFLISFGRFVKVKASSNADNTIQNQVSPLLIAKSQIKQGISAIT